MFHLVLGVLYRHEHVEEMSEQSCHNYNTVYCSCVAAGFRIGVHFAFAPVCDDGNGVQELSYGR